MSLHLETGEDGKVLVLGGGLTGLTASERLWANDVPNTVIEYHGEVGGLARTINYKGFRYDLGGHRFVTDNKYLLNYVNDLLHGDYLQVRRSSKILMQGKWFDYPLRPINALFGFGINTSSKILADYGYQWIQNFFRARQAVSLKDWVITNFGRTLFELYFHDYSEKAWGLKCDRIDQSWVRQRIQGLTLGKAMLTALFPGGGKIYRTLDDEFIYPATGIGAIADALAGLIRQHQAIQTSTKVTKLFHGAGKIQSVEINGSNGPVRVPAQQVISTLPLQALVKCLSPEPPAQVMAAAQGLRSRDMIILTLMLDKKYVTDQTWIYVPDRDIPFARIHEPKNWSPSMAPPDKTALVLEYFCFRGDEIWRTSDQKIAQQARDQLVNLGLIARQDMLDYQLLRVPNAYPLFEVGYVEKCHIINDYLASFTNLHLAGRGGSFQYYNMDHAMLSGMQVARVVAEKLVMAPETPGLMSWHPALSGVNP